MASRVIAHQEDPCLRALAVALQHPAVAADQRNICTLLQVSKAWRAAVQQSAASMTHIDMFGEGLTDDLSRISSFAGWLAKYPGLISTICMRFWEGYAPVQQSKTVMQVAYQLADLSLQAAAAASVFGSGAPLRLRSLHTSEVPTSRMLSALPAATLTRLRLEEVDNSSWHSALSKLHNLQEMQLDMYRIGTQAADSCLQALAPLKQLTQLVLEGIPGAVDMGLLPPQLQHLKLEYAVWNNRSKFVPPADNRVIVDLQHLTCLQHLLLSAEKLANGALVPPNLLSLSVKAEWPEQGLMSLNSLQQLTSMVVQYNQYDSRPIKGEDLIRMQMCSQLQSLSLDLRYNMDHSQHLMEVSAAWRKLPLCGLSIVIPIMTLFDLQQLVQHVAVATKLTQLSINIVNIGADEHEIEAPGIIVCEHLKNLTNLETLNLKIGHPGDFAIQDAQHLTALTALTSLCLCNGGAGPYVDDATACLLACHLTQLRSLSIDAPSLGIAVLPAIGRLTTLRMLKLMTRSSEDAQRGLQFLTGLSRLTSLEGFARAGGPALDRFHACITAQKQLAGVEPNHMLLVFKPF